MLSINYIKYNCVIPNLIVFHRMASSVSFAHAVAELVACLLFLGMSLVAFLYSLTQRPWRTDPSQRTMKTCFLILWLLLITRAVVQTMLMTNILFSFTDDWSCNLMYTLLLFKSALNVPVLLAFFYQMNLGFQSGKVMYRFKIWIYILTLDAAGFSIASPAMGPVGRVTELSTSNSDGYQYHICVYSGQGFIGLAVGPFVMMTMIALNIAFIIRSKQIWKKSAGQLNQIKSIEKCEKLDRSIGVIIRHCIICSLLMAATMTRIVMVFFGAQSIWFVIVVFCLFSLLFPWTNTIYKVLFYSIHTRIFRRWRTLYADNVKRIAAQNIHRFFVEMHQDTFDLQFSPADLRSALENESSEVHHTIRQAYRENKDEELQLSISQFVAKSENLLHQSPFEIDCEYKSILGNLLNQLSRKTLTVVDESSLVYPTA